MNKNLRFFLLLSVTLLPLLVAAEEAPAHEALPAIDPGDDRFFYEFMNMLTTLGLIVAAIFVISWLLKRMTNTRIQQANTTSLIKIVDRRALSPKACMYLVEIHGKQFVVGETAANIAVLGEFPAEAEKDER